MSYTVHKHTNKRKNVINCITSAEGGVIIILSCKAVHILVCSFSLQIEPGYIEKRLCHTMPVLCENPTLASVIDTVISSSYLAVQPQLLPEIQELVAMWFVEGQALDYYRSAHSHFIASIGGV